MTVPTPSAAQAHRSVRCGDSQSLLTACKHSISDMATRVKQPQRPDAQTTARPSAGRHRERRDGRLTSAPSVTRRLPACRVPAHHPTFATASQRVPRSDHARRPVRANVLERSRTSFVPPHSPSARSKHSPRSSACKRAARSASAPGRRAACQPDAGQRPARVGGSQCRGRDTPRSGPSGSSAWC